MTTHEMSLHPQPVNDYSIRLGRCRQDISDLKTDYAREEGRLPQLKANQRELELNIKEQEDLSEVCLQVRTLFETLTESKREMVRTKIESLVTHGVQAVFGPTYSFKIEQRLNRNQVTFEYRIYHDFDGESHESDLRGTHGGGLVALVGFLLRLVMVLYAHPTRRRIIFLDESMAALDGDKRPQFAALLSTLGEKLQCQFVLITHSEEYSEEADKLYLISPSSSGGSKLVLQT